MKSVQDSPIDIEYVILENIYAAAPKDSPLRQRDLAQLARTSLGMTNSILKRLAQKGWITVKKLNSRNIRYAVTLDGFNEILHRSYSYFKRTISNVAFYRGAIDEAIQAAARNGFTAVLLAGNSDLDFIVEHACRHSGLAFLQSSGGDAAPDTVNEHTMTVFAEGIPFSVSAPARNSLFLSQLLIKGPAIA
ncbi:MAG: transcriptional regulator [Treponema sp.]|jgi:DNA-binding MarR family transcriptional regulator|nr:transcriptional regulator [Treponema sp.]